MGTLTTNQTKMNRKRGFLLVFVGCFFALAILIFRPVPQTIAENAVFVSGIVKSIHEGGGNDLVFRLQGVSQVYYINRGLEQGLALNELQAKLIGEKVEIVFPEYWTPLDWNNHVRHLSRLRIGQEIIFDETRGRELSYR